MGRTLVWCLVVIAGCSKSGSGPSGGSGTGATTTTSDPCSAAALKLGSAKLMTPFQMPDGCSLVDGGPGSLLYNDEVAAAHVKCTGAPLGVDFTKNNLVVKETTLSPAQTGVLAYDDGKTITWVNRQRTPCPDDPQPMPVPVSLVFMIEAQAGRAFDETHCTVTTTCK